ncbi:MAG: RNA-binding protein [Bryobacteraceae bacterium]|nr:RNA-binding protein [Bryobacteraceae bacterium]
MKNIFVGNLSFGATEDLLRSVFEPYGAVERVSIITDRTTGQSRGFAFVEMTSSEEADRAIASLDGRELNGRMMKVNEARPRAGRELAGSGGRGSHGGGKRRFNRW